MLLGWNFDSHAYRLGNRYRWAGSITSQLVGFQPAAVMALADGITGTSSTDGVTADTTAG